MAQSKSFFSLRKGSTKTLTFSVYNGKQVTKDRVTDVKNPRSSLQMKQRAIMATALHAYSTLKEICDHSFEGLTYGQKSMNYFVSQNIRMLRSTAPNVNLSMFKGNSVSNAYVISMGSLKKVALYDTEDSGIKYFCIDIEPITASTTFANLMGNFGATQIGDMVTIVNLVNNPGGNASVYFVRLKLTEANKAKVVGSSESNGNILSKLEEGTDFETNIDNFSPEDFAISWKGSLLFIGGGTLLSNPTQQSMGIILSRKSNTGWLRSPSTMLDLIDTYNYAEAIATYPESGEKILNGGNM